MEELRALVRTPLLQNSPLSQYRRYGGELRLHHQNAVFVTEGDTHYVAIFGRLEWEDFTPLTDMRFGEAEFEVIVESETGTEFERELTARGWTCVEEETAMAMTVIPPILPDQPVELSIARVGTVTSYEDYMSVVPGNRVWVPSLDAAIDPEVGLFVGYVDEQPVATSRLTLYGSVAEITGVRTVEPHRQQGIGSAMTWAAIMEATMRGCRSIMLTSTEMGYSLYRKMGFTDVCTYRIYAKQ